MYLDSKFDAEASMLLFKFGDGYWKGGLRGCWHIQIFDTCKK